jgi:dipeptidyl aminopeptidase/acylaminoacyl peptidase
MSDGRGNVRFMESERLTDATGQMSARIDYFYRRTGSSDWDKFASFDSLSGEGMIPVAIDATLDSAYLLKKLNGRFALYRVKLDGSMATELAYANDKVDVDNVVRIGRGQKVIGATFAEERRETVYFDEEYARLAKSLSKAIPNLPLVQFASASADGNKLLIFAGSDSDPGRYYVYDKKGRALNEIMLVRPALEKATLAAMKPVTYPAADGTPIPAYLSVPPGKDARSLPAVIMPHGGPSARDEWGFDWLTQYLVSQGYAVLQPNYRGSAGYGDEWANENGFRGWRTSIGDITAGANWLVGEGIADRGKLAIVGWSYGGYAALQSAAVEPDLYRAVVAIAPVTDLAQLKQDARGFTNARLVADFVGAGPHVREGSPLQNVDGIKAPVLMFHGNRDANVDVGHAERMDRALKAAGKRSELTVFEGLEHSLVDSGARTRMLESIGGFLAAEVAR